VRPLSTVEYTSVASVFDSWQWSNFIHDRCSCTLFKFSPVSSSECLFYAWKVSRLDVSTQAWTSQAWTGEWVTIRWLTLDSIVEIGRKSRSWINTRMPLMTERYAAEPVPLLKGMLRYGTRILYACASGYGRRYRCVRQRSGIHAVPSVRRRPAGRPCSTQRRTQSICFTSAKTTTHQGQRRASSVARRREAINTSAHASLNRPSGAPYRRR